MRMLRAFKLDHKERYRRPSSLISIRALLITLIASVQVRGALAQIECGKDASGRLCQGGLSCCSQYGYCGNSTDYCGPGCQSGNCSSISSPVLAPGQCDNNNLCKDATLCCSKYRFCGSTPDYCGIDNCLGGPCHKVPNTSHGLSTGAYVGIALAILLAIIAALSAVLFFHFRRGHRKLKRTEVSDRDFDSDGIQFPRAHLDLKGIQISRALSFAPIKLSYEALDDATDGFANELGRGAFGVVYKGTLRDEHMTHIAVKKLVDNEHGLRDFEAEVKTLGSINHGNLVALLGFCMIERNQPFLIYEYVSNGSLDKWIFAKERSLDVTFHPLPWETRVDIAKGTAKGLAYLHEDLQIGHTIVHLDIKPENILLDASFTPKVADFGMAKLLGSKKTQTIASGGTFGYMAPELVYTGSATGKMDVYSFGMVLLELLSGRRNLDLSLPVDRFYLPSWAIRKYAQREELDVLDQIFFKEEEHGFDAEVARRLILVALLCLQRDPEERPDMSNVLRMIEGTSIPWELPDTLQSELEMTERILRGQIMASPTESPIESNFIDSYRGSKSSTFTSDSSFPIRFQSEAQSDSSLGHGSSRLAR